MTEFNIYSWDIYFTFSLIVSLLSVVLFILNIIFIFQKNYKEKVSSYECGFQPFNILLGNFDIKYYLVAILFLLFDLEFVFIIPWIASINFIGFFGFFSMIFFLLILFLGFFYEWIKGGLEWD